jgi:hypothetical protein
MALLAGSDDLSGEHNSPTQELINRASATLHAMQDAE